MFRSLKRQPYVTTKGWGEYPAGTKCMVYRIKTKANPYGFFCLEFETLDVIRLDGSKYHAKDLELSFA